LFVPLGAIPWYLVAIGIAAAAASLLVSLALLQQWPWGRIPGIVLGVVSVANIPLGTALGIYAVVILTRKEAVALFRRSRPDGPTA